MDASFCFDSGCLPCQSPASSTSPPKPTTSAAATPNTTSPLRRECTSTVDRILYTIRCSRVIVPGSGLCEALRELLSPVDPVQRKAPVIASSTIGIFPDDVPERIDVLHFFGVRIFVVATDHFVIETSNVFLKLRVCFIAYKRSAKRRHAKLAT